jgi:predicted DNA-binding transcriptional regulator YafY
VPAVMVSEGEILGILLGAHLLKAYEGTPFAKDLNLLFKKIEAMLPEKVEIRLEHIQSGITFCNPPARKLDPAIWLIVLRAVIHQRVLTITYQSPAAGKEKEHILHPYHVLNLEGEWYLLAYNEQHQSISQFAIPRIKAARLSARTFQIPDTFKVNDVLATRFGRYLHHGETKKPITVKLLIAPVLATWAGEKEWHPKQKLIRRKGGAVELHLPIADTRDIEPWILSLGEHVRILGPKSLATTIRQRHLNAITA